LAIKSPFTICNCCTFLFFFVAGIVLLSTSAGSQKFVDFVCDNEDAKGIKGDVVQFFTNIYTKSDEFYCKSDCPCNADMSDFENNTEYADFYNDMVTDDNSVISVQWCPTLLE